MTSHLKAIHIIYGMNGGGIDYVAKKYNNSKVFTQSNLFVIRPFSNQYDRPVDDKTNIIYFNALALIKFRSNLIATISKFNPSHVFLHGFNALILYYICFPRLTKNIKLIHTYHGEYHPSSFLQYCKSIVLNELVPFLLKTRKITVISVCNYSN